MGPELRKVADTIMSDLGMGEDQDKIDALEQFLEENLSLFFSEDSYMSSVIKMGAEKSFTSHSAKIKDFLTRGIGGGTIMEGAAPTGASSSPDIAIGRFERCHDGGLTDFHLRLAADYRSRHRIHIDPHFAFTKAV